MQSFLVLLVFYHPHLDQFGVLSLILFPDSYLFIYL